METGTLILISAIVIAIALIVFFRNLLKNDKPLCPPDLEWRNSGTTQFNWDTDPDTGKKLDKESVRDVLDILDNQPCSAVQEVLPPTVHSEPPPLKKKPVAKKQAAKKKQSYKKKPVSERRVFSVDVGDVKPKEIKKMIKDVKKEVKTKK